MAGRPQAPRNELLRIAERIRWKKERRDDYTRAHQLLEAIVDREVGRQERKLRDNPPFDAVTGAAARAIQIEKQKHKKELQAAREDAAMEAFKDLLGQAVLTKVVALERALSAGRLADGTIDPHAIDPKDLKLAVQVADSVTDRVLGKASQKIETKNEHTFWMKLAEQGDLD